MSRIRPRLWPTLIALPAFLILIGLGIWQVDRLAWKTELLATIDARMSAPAVTLPTAIDDPSAWDYRRVTVDGTFEPGRALRLVSRVHGGQAGEQVIVPLVRDDVERPGQIVLVDQGWVPNGWQPDAGTVEGTVTGILHVPTRPGWLQPANDPQANTWFFVDLDAMAAAVGAAQVFPLVLYQDAGPTDAPPIGGQLRVDLPNNHLNYAITWFSLAFVLLVIYVLFHLRRPSEKT